MGNDDLASCLGYMKYSGSLTAEGLMDAGELGAALVSFRAAISSMVAAEFPDHDLSTLRLPVRIERGSIWALVPDSVEVWLLASAGLAATAYITAAATKMAQKDFEGVGLRQVLQNAIGRLAQVVRIALHVGETGQTEFKRTKWRRNNKEVGIPNAEGQYIYVPTEAIEAYISFQPQVLAGMIRPVQQDRELSIAVVHKGGTDEVRITVASKHILLPDEDDNEAAILPELRHGDEVAIAGKITRGNENTNSIGIFHKGHVLDCHPVEGSITRFRDCLFQECVVEATVDRRSLDGRPDAKKPKLMLRSVEVARKEPEDHRLF
jgi:hypothetical protein